MTHLIAVWGSNNIGNSKTRNKDKALCWLEHIDIIHERRLRYNWVCEKVAWERFYANAIYSSRQALGGICHDRNRHFATF